MIEVGNKLLTTPVVCNICGHKMQIVCEVKTITDGDKTEVKLPNDFTCTKCESPDVTFTDF